MVCTKWSEARIANQVCHRLFSDPCPAGSFERYQQAHARSAWFFITQGTWLSKLDWLISWDLDCFARIRCVLYRFRRGFAHLSFSSRRALCDVNPIGLASKILTALVAPVLSSSSFYQSTGEIAAQDKRVVHPILLGQENSMLWHRRI